MKKSIYTCILFFSFIFTLHSQNYSLQVLDQESMDPIQDVFVFLSNSQQGESSDEKGILSLEIQPGKLVELVITHINYHDTIIRAKSVEFLPEEVLLRSRAFKLDVITVKDKKSGKRKKWLKKFEKALLGRSDNGKKAKIKNKDVVIFEEKNDTLFAYANALIEIENKKVGYDLLFFLQEFQLYKEEVVYAGKAFFKETKDNDEILKQRNKTYNRSIRDYFTTILTGKNTERYRSFSINSLQEDKIEPELYTPELEIIRLFQKGAWALKIDDYLVIEDHKEAIYKKGVMGMEHISFPTTILSSRTGFVSFDNFGNILNPEDIIEKGAYTTDRIADLLPREYAPSEPVVVSELAQLEPQSWSVLTADSEDFLINQYDLDNHTYCKEKIYLHTDKSFYAAGDEVWFQLYLLDGTLHQPSSYSKIAYIELIDPEKNIISKVLKKVDNGTAYSHFLLPDDLYEGTYFLRAYTELMAQHQEQDLQFKEIYVQGVRKESLADARINMEEETLEVNEVEIRFFPEGGDLISGFQNKVVFEVYDGFKELLDFKGALYDDEENLIVNIETTTSGLGYFVFTPEEGNSYTVRQPTTSHQTWNLPSVHDSKVHMSIENRREDYIRIDVKTAGDVDSLVLVGHRRGDVIMYLKNLETQSGMIKVLKDDLPPGLIHFTLFNNEGKPLSERLVFNEMGIELDQLDLEDVVTDHSSENSRQMVLSKDVGIGMDSLAYVSISVRKNAPRFDIENIQSYLYMNSDLDRIVENPGELLEDMNYKKRFILDLLMLSRGWRRFDWEALKDAQDMYQAIEKGITISGYVSEVKDSSKRVESTVSLSILSEDFFNDVVTTDEDGNFTLSNVPFSDSLYYLLQARKGISKGDEIVLDGSREVAIHIHEAAGPELNYLPETQLSRGNSRGTFLMTMDRSRTIQDDIAMSVDVEEVVIKERRGRPDTRAQGYWDIDDYDWIPQEVLALDFATTIAPGLRIVSRGLGFINNGELGGIAGLLTSGKLFFTFVNRRGVIVRAPLAVVINGKLQDNHSRFLGITMDQVKYMSAGKGFISIVTYPGGSRSKMNSLTQGVLAYIHPDADKYRDFYEPLTLNNAPESAYGFNRTLQWLPNVTLRNNEKFIINFEDITEEDDVEVVVEGITQGGNPLYLSKVIKLQK